MDYPNFRRLEQAVIATAKKHGFDGQPFAARPLPIGTEVQEMDAIYLSLAVSPRPLTDQAKKLVREWTHNIVLSSGQQLEETSRPSLAKKERSRAW